MVELTQSVASHAVSAASAEPPAPGTGPRRWRTRAKPALDYLLDSEIHTFAFSVAANAIISFIPFCVLLYTLAFKLFRLPALIPILNDMVNSFLPTQATDQAWLVRNIQVAAFKSSAGGLQAFSLAMILISCTGIFLPLEVALNKSWGVRRSRNYLMNQTVAFGLAILMVVLGVVSLFLNFGFQRFLGDVTFGHTDNFAVRGLSYLWLAFSTGVATILFFFSIYWVLPNCKVPWRPVLRTSVIAGAVWLVAKLIFAAVLPRLHLSDLYASFYISVGLLFWGYISGLILFAGAQFSVSHLGGRAG